MSMATPRRGSGEALVRLGAVIEGQQPSCHLYLLCVNLSKILFFQCVEGIIGDGEHLGQGGQLSTKVYSANFCGHKRGTAGIQVRCWVVLEAYGRSGTVRKMARSLRCDPERTGGRMRRPAGAPGDPTLRGSLPRSQAFLGARAGWSSRCSRYPSRHSCRQSSPCVVP